MKTVNKWGLEIPQKLIDEYVEKLLGDIFKLLPIFEGRDIKTKQIIVPPEIAYEQFQKYLQNLIFETAGGFYAFDDDVQFLKLLLKLEGMQQIKQNQHKKLRSLVFNCIDICKKLKGDGDG